MLSLNSGNAVRAESSGHVDFTRVFGGRRVFVTGHTGFKGSWLCLWLHHLGAKVTGFSLAPPTDPNHYSVARIDELIDQHYDGDIRDELAMQKAIADCQPDIIFHLAAETIVRRSYLIPRETFDINVMGTVNVLEGIRQLNHPCAVVAVTSDKCYENREQVWGYRESDAFGEHDPYGASKGAAEIAIRAYRESYFRPDRLLEHGVRVASARAGNVIGGGDFTPDALVVDAVMALHEGRPIGLRNPRALRPWQHVLQALSGYLTLGAGLMSPAPERYCDGWNFGPLPGNDLPVQQFVEHLIRQWGTGSWIDTSDPRQPAESCILRLSIDKAIWQLGWKPLWDIETALRYTLQWYRAYFQGTASCMRTFGLRQIEEFESDLQSSSQRQIASPTVPIENSLIMPALN